MMDIERLDLSVLDPAREPERWRTVVENTRARMDAAIAARAVYADPFAVIHQWARPLLAAAALIAVVWTPLLAGLDRAGGVNGASDSRARILSSYTVEWVRTGRAPTPAQLSGLVEDTTMPPGGV